MSAVTFLSPEKFPNLRRTGKQSSPAISLKEDRIGINVTLFNQLNNYLPGFTNIHIFEEEGLDEEKKTVFRYFILPCKDAKAWKVKFNSKSTSCSFTSKALSEVIRAKWGITEPLILHKIPISETVQTVKDYKGFQIEISQIEPISK